MFSNFLSIMNPNNFKLYTRNILLYTSLTCIAFFVIGLYFALIDSPPDYQQKEMVRVMYIHVPAAWMSLGIYIFLTINSIINLVFKARLGYVLSLSSAPIGACFTFITLVTGCLWGKPIWGAYWVWDARLTSTLILFIIYLSYIAIINSADNVFEVEKSASIIAIIGAINIPIIKFSVNLWNSLHQPASVVKYGGLSIHSSMLIPLILMFIAYSLYFICMLIVRVNTFLINIKYNDL